MEELTLLIWGGGLDFLLLLDKVVASRGMMQRVVLGGRMCERVRKQVNGMYSLLGNFLIYVNIYY